MQEHNTCAEHKTRQTQALRLVILTGSQSLDIALQACQNSGQTHPRSKARQT